MTLISNQHYSLVRCTYTWWSISCFRLLGQLHLTCYVDVYYSLQTPRHHKLDIYIFTICSLSLSVSPPLSLSLILSLNMTNDASIWTVVNLTRLDLSLPSMPLLSLIDSQRKKLWLTTRNLLYLSKYSFTKDCLTSTQP